MEIFSPIPVFIVTISYGIPKNKPEDNPGDLSPKPRSPIVSILIFM